MLPKPTWLIQGILPLDAVGMLYGKSQTFKSFVALDWALSISLGMNWNIREVKQGIAVYVAAEGATGYMQRIDAWALHHGIAAETIADAPFMFKDSPVQLFQGDDLEPFLADLADLPELPKLIVIDTLGRSMDGGDEKDNSDFHQVVASAEQIRRATNAQVLLIHHEGHTSTGKPRGASAMEGDITTMINASLDNNSVHLKCGKQKNAARFEPITLHAHSVQLPDDESSLVLLEQATIMAVSSTAPVPIKSARLKQDMARRSKKGDREAIYRFVQAQGEPVDALQVSKYFGISVQAARMHLRRLVDDGKLIKNERGKYTVASQLAA